MDNLEKTKASFNYRNPLIRGEPKPAFGLKEEDASMPNHTSHMKTIQNARLKEFSIETSGFELLNHKSAVKDFFNDLEVTEIYYPEMTKLVKERVLADEVHIVSHISRNEAEVESGKRKGAHRLVHNDFTPNFKSTLEPLLEETNSKPSKILVFNLWRRFDKDGIDAPFALCDARTVNEKELIPTDLHNYLEGQEDSLTVEIYQSSFSEKHQWNYYPKMNRDEVLMFKTYDSTLNPFMPTLHSAFDDNSFGDKEVSPRKSLEVRAICFFN